MTLEKMMRITFRDLRYHTQHRYRHNDFTWDEYFVHYYKSGDQELREKLEDIVEEELGTIIKRKKEKAEDIEAKIRLLPMKLKKKYRSML